MQAPVGRALSEGEGGPKEPRVAPAGAGRLAPGSLRSAVPRNAGPARPGPLLLSEPARRDACAPRPLHVPVPFEDRRSLLNLDVDKPRVELRELFVRAEVRVRRVVVRVVPTVQVTDRPSA